MKRYCVVLQNNDRDTVVEFYWADSYEHAEEQATDANPSDYWVVASVRDPEHAERG